MAYEVYGAAVGIILCHAGSIKIQALLWPGRQREILAEDVLKRRGGKLSRQFWQKRGFATWAEAVVAALCETG